MVKVYLICYTLNYTPDRIVPTNLRYHCMELNYNDLIKFVFKYAKDTYNCSSIGITNIIKIDS